MNLIEKYEHTDLGYNPNLVGEKWQVAILNYAPAEDVMNLDSLDVHFLTDEAFILLEGNAVLIGATIEDDKVNFEMIDMQPGIIYNIPRNMWHKIATEQGSKVLIVEDANTHLGDYKFYYLSQDQIKELREKVAEAKSGR